jgi:sulfatase maturation enzyme AslB (radical SAM superfamily)
MTVAKHIINRHEKRNETGEIILILFEYCDLDCVFCMQDHDSMVGVDTIVNKIEPLRKSVEQLLTKGKDNFQVHLMGGELFSDKLPDSIFDDYLILINSIRSLAEEKNVVLEISIATNYIFTKTERVKKFIQAADVIIMSSYDPAGRFNTENFEIFKNNLQEFKEYTRAVGIVMTKQNIDKFIKGNIPFFDYIYDNFVVFFDHYGPQKNQNILSPKDVELRDFMIHMLDHWPRAKPFDEYRKKTKNPMVCMDTVTIMADGSWGGCGQAEGLVKFIPLKKVMEDQWFAEYNCLECKHFSRCALGCFMSNHIKNMRTQETCYLSEVYDYIDKK